MTEPQIDWVGQSRDRARRRRELGMRRSAEHAEDAAPGWINTAVSQLRVFVAQRSGAPFLTEDFRRWAQTRLTAPPDGRAYGHVMKRAARLGVIQSNGFAAADSSNGSPKVLWQQKAPGASSCE